MNERLTPREELSKEKRQKVLAQFQWNKGLSISEMQKYFLDMASIKTQELLDKQSPQEEITKEFPEISGADYALNHYKPMSDW